jgi:hypothetical protein
MILEGLHVYSVLFFQDLQSTPGALPEMWHLRDSGDRDAAMIAKDLFLAKDPHRIGA